MGKAITKIILGLIFGFVLLIIVNRIHDYFEEQSYRIEVVGENGKVYESYNEALNNLDFVAAHSFVDKMNENEKRNPHIYSWDVREAYYTVFKKEVSFLLLDNNVDNAKVIYLIREVSNISDCSKNDLCDYVLEMSIFQKNEELCKMVLDEYTNDTYKEEATNKYKQALKDGKFD